MYVRLNLCFEFDELRLKILKLNCPDKSSFSSLKYIGIGIEVRDIERYRKILELNHRDERICPSYGSVFQRNRVKNGQPEEKC